MNSYNVENKNNLLNGLMFRISYIFEMENYWTMYG